MPRVNRRRRIGISGLVLWALGTALCVITWGRTGDIVVDFGHELYAADQIAHGRVLYRDVFYLYGPLPVYVNAAAMSVSGAGVTAVRAVNLLVLIAAAALVYRIVLVITDQFTATTAGVVFLTTFAFCSTTTIANYNFITPYSHGATYGLALGLAVVAMCGRLARTGRPIDAACIGVLTGLSVMTKPEMFLGCLTAATAGIAAAMSIHAGAWPMRKLGLLLAWFIGGIIVPPLLGWMAMCRALPPKTAAAMVSGWGYVRGDILLRSKFYRWGLGIDDVSRSLMLMARSTLLYASIAAALLGFAVVVRRLSAEAAKWAMVGAFIAIFGVVLMFGNDRTWENAGRGLPVFCACACGIALVGVLKRWRDVPPQRLVTSLSLSILALALLAKMILNARVTHYGFVLAAPATVLFVTWLCGWMPAIADESGWHGGVVRAGGLAVALAVAVFYALMTLQVRAMRSYPVELPGGTINQMPYDAPVFDAASAIERSTNPDTTLAVIPDAAGLNYLTGRANPTPCDSLNPMEMAQLGEANVLRQFQKTPPDLILLLDEDFTNDGYRGFGIDYGRDLAAWIGKEYQIAGHFSRGDAAPGRPGVQVLIRRETTRPATQ
jgi:hypothetical protein